MPENYLKPHKDYFWHWEDDGNVIAIPNGSTIAYTSLIEEYLTSLLPQRLPPFGALLLVLIALKPNGKKDFEVILKLIENNKDYGQSTDIRKALNFMKLLANLPEKYKVGNGKIVLLKTLFEDCHGIMSFARSKRIVDFFEELPESIFQYASTIHRNHEFLAPFRVLSLLGRKFRTVEEFLQKLESLPEVIDDILLEDDISVDSTDWMNELLEHEETFHVGALVKTIWAGIHIPFHNTVPSQQSMGGISDLTNKGNFDQLLISEFANDDLVFLSRLANNEALYLNRESPPASNNSKRVILLDISLKNWGTPKIVSFATMLAIAKHPKSEIDCDIYVFGSDALAIKIDSVDEIINALQIVQACRNGAEGLAYFFQKTNLSNAEIFIISEKSTYQSNDMFKVINENSALVDYFIHTDVNGIIDIFRNSKSGKRHLQHLELPLKNLWKREILETRKRPSAKCFYPILIQRSNRVIHFFPTSNGEVFQVTKDGFVLRYFNGLEEQKNRGWEIFYEGLNFRGKEIELGWNEKGEYILLIFTRQNKEICLLNLNTNHEIRLFFDHWKHVDGPNFIFRENHFYHVNQWGKYRIDLEGGISDSNFYFGNKFVINHKEKLTSIKNKYHLIQNIFKNVSNVGINESGQLMFNVHKLLLNQNDKIRLKTTHDSRDLIHIAKQTSENLFLFDDGSTVEVKACGLIILKSSDEFIPNIYIPSIIESNLALATESEFAGSQFYYNEPTFELVLHNIKNSTLLLKKWIRKMTNYSLTEIKILLRSDPVIIPLHLNENQKDDAKKELDLWNIEYDFSPCYPDFQPLKIISPNQFFHNYVHPFITTIQNHET